MTTPQVPQVTIETISMTKGAVTQAALRPLLAAAFLLVGYFLLPINHDSHWNQLGLALGAGLLLAFCTWEVWQFRHSHHPIPAALELLTAVTGFYLVSFATTYFIFSDYSQHSFNEKLTRIDALYFCLTVFTTTGFGDISAQSQGARIAVSIQMVTTFVIIGLGVRFFSMLVGDRLKADRDSNTRSENESHSG